MGSKHAAAVLPLTAILSMLVSAPARAQDAAATAREALDALAKDEASAPAGRLTVRITDRRASHVAGESQEALRARVEKEPATSGRGTFLYGRDGWLKDLTVEITRPEPRALRTRTSESRGELRVLMELKAGEKDQKQARVSRVTSTAPGDAVLGRRAAEALKGVEWTTAKTAGDLLTLEGKRGEERHTLALLRGDRTRIRTWTLVRRLTAPTGEQVEQTYRCELSGGETEARPLRLEEWVITPPPGAGVAARVTEVTKTEPLPSLAPEDLRVRFPAGTLVSDARNDVTVEYEQTEDTDETEIAETARLLAAGRAKAGEAAPPFTVKDAKGKTHRLSDFDGKPLVLVWFAAKMRNADAAGGYLRTLADDYRKKGVQFLLLLGEDGDWKSEAESLRKQHSWSFPVAVDEGGQTMRRYGHLAALPKVAVVDRNGALAYVQAGLKPDEIAAAIEKVLPRK